MNAQPVAVGEMRAAHGEGPVWDPHRKRLFWVDIIGCSLRALDPTTGQIDSVQFPEMVCAIAPTGQGDLLVAFAKRLAWVSWPWGVVVNQILLVEPHLPRNRCNDGKRDPAGRFWIGTMSDDGCALGAGSLYRLEFDNSLTRVLGELTIANGLAWSSDARTMYFIDSPTREIWAFDFNLSDSSIGRRRTVVRVPNFLGLPDGMTIDSDGMLWVAHWGSGCVCRWDPATGQLLDTLQTGCPHTSSCEFGGEQGNELFITTSRLGLDAAALRNAPSSGRLLRVTLECGRP